MDQGATSPAASGQESAVQANQTQSGAEPGGFLAYYFRWYFCTENRMTSYNIRAEICSVRPPGPISLLVNGG